MSKVHKLKNDPTLPGIDMADLSATVNGSNSKKGPTNKINFGENDEGDKTDVILSNSSNPVKNMFKSE